MIEIKGIKLPVGHNKNKLEQQIIKKLGLKQIPTYEILKRSIDARKKPDIFYIYNIGVYLNNEQKTAKRINDKNIMLTCKLEYHFPKPGNTPMKHHPLIIGAGPAGLFCGLQLAKMGYHPIIIDRGSCIETRTNVVNHFFETGELNTECNIQFGEGGAGTFSDGKLNTQVKDQYGRIRYVLETFVKHGANPEILFDFKPHVGTDVLKNVIINLRKEIEAYGGIFSFDTKVTDFRFENGRITGAKLLQDDYETWVDTSVVVLAIGHSARDTFEVLYHKKINMSAKDFAMGVRVEHLASWIQDASYGDGKAASILPAAPYKLTYQSKNDRGVYSFCMCPGGYVVNASSEEGRTAVNGMSYSGRSGVNSNSAIVVSVKQSDFGSEHPLAGIYLQRQLEENIYKEGNGKVVVQTFKDFCENQVSSSIGEVTPQIMGGYSFGNLNNCLPDYITDSIKEAMPIFGKRIANFDHPDTILSGVESRTSSPVRIWRNESFESNYSGLYPCGEGAGYAGGIMSAAVDGIKVAEKIIEQFAPKNNENCHM
ncbi:MAG: NAD(P)/FAD-dependent oxidoreductase [Lachnospiraceae bacterium]